MTIDHPDDPLGRWGADQEDKGKVTPPSERTRQAIEDCARWLVECLHLGWQKSSLNALEALWWRHHDERGNLTTL